MKKFRHLHDGCINNVKGNCRKYGIEVERINFRCDDYKSSSMAQKQQAEFEHFCTDCQNNTPYDNENCQKCLSGSEWQSKDGE